jgi:GAF domain-containing protein
MEDKRTQESDRLRCLRSYSVLDTPREEAFDDLTRLAAQICRTPVATIGFMDERRYWIKSSVGVAISEIPRALSFCDYSVVTGEPLEVEDATQDVRFAALPMVVGPERIRFYAGTPLLAPQGGHVLGTLCVAFGRESPAHGGSAPRDGRKVSRYF